MYDLRNECQFKIFKKLQYSELCKNYDADKFIHVKENELKKNQKIKSVYRYNNSVANFKTRQ